MSKYEFVSKIGPRGEINLPQEIVESFGKGTLVNFVAYKESQNNIKSAIKNPMSKDAQEFWNNYNFDGIWNGD